MPVLLTSIDAALVDRIRRGLMRLTPAQVRTVRELMSGGSIQEIADKLDLSPSTIGYQIQCVLQLCGCTRYQLMRGVFELREDKDLEAKLLGQFRRAILSNDARFKRHRRQEDAESR